MAAIEAENRAGVGKGQAGAQGGAVLNRTAFISDLDNHRKRDFSLTAYEIFGSNTADSEISTPGHKTLGKICGQRESND